MCGILVRAAVCAHADVHQRRLEASRSRFRRTVSIVAMLCLM
jgi:hypothetical protein